MRKPVCHLLIRGSFIATQGDQRSLNAGGKNVVNASIYFSFKFDFWLNLLNNWINLFHEHSVQNIYVLHSLFHYHTMYVQHNFNNDHKKLILESPTHPERFGAPRVKSPASPSECWHTPQKLIATGDHLILSTHFNIPPLHLHSSYS